MEKPRARLDSMHTYRRVGLNSSSSAGSQNAFSESFPPGGSRTRRLGMAVTGGRPCGSDGCGSPVSEPPVTVARDAYLEKAGNGGGGGRVGSRSAARNRPSVRLSVACERVRSVILRTSSGLGGAAANASSMESSRKEILVFPPGASRTRRVGTKSLLKDELWSALESAVGLPRSPSNLPNVQYSGPYG